MLSALLNELDGASSSEGILLLAATNRKEELDLALVRPGRLDHHVELGFPHRQDYPLILAACCESMPCDESILSSVAQLLPDNTTGAQIDAYCQEAAKVAFREANKPQAITMTHFTSALSMFEDKHATLRR